MLNRARSFVLAALVFFTACHKDSTPPKPPVPPPVDSSKTTPTVGTMNINLVRTGVPSSVGYELVISEPGGKVLLDTATHYTAAIKATLQTNANLVDITLVDTNRGRYNITMYKSVNPSTWRNLPIYYASVYFTSPYLAATNATTYFNHFPAAYSADPNSPSNMFFMNGTSNSISGNSGAGAITFNYQRHPGVYSYLGFLNLGLYKLYIPQSDHDTVDLTHMDTANTLNFTRPASWRSSFYDLSGIPDSTYRYKDIKFCTGGFLGQQPKADIVYPKEPMQAYELSFFVTDPNYNYYGFYSWGKTIPANPLFLEASYINVTNSAIDNFAVSFGGPITYYYAGFSDQATVSLTLYASPDSVSVHPLTTLNNQKCKWLAGVSYSNIKLSQITAERAPGYTYPAYIQYVTDSTKVQMHQLNFSSFIIKAF